MSSYGSPLPARGRARLALAGGFGGLLGLLVFLGVYAAQSLNRVRVADTESSRAYLLRHDRLETVRSSAFLASQYVRDYLLDPDPAAYIAHREQARHEWNRMKAALLQYKRVASPDRQALAATLESDLDAYWLLADAGLELTEEERRTSGYDLLSGRLGPARERFYSALDAMRNQDLAELRTAIHESASFLDILQLHLVQAIAFSLLLGMALAAAAWWYVAKLETEAAQRYMESVAAAGQLEQLSHRLLAVQEEERRNLARELHDEVGQNLSALMMDLGQIRSALQQHSQTEAEARLRAAVDLNERTLRSVRDIALLLRPSMLDDLGLIPALHWHARETSRRTGVDVTFESGEDELDLGDDTRTTVYRVVQEALQNAVRHSRARKVEVALLTNDGRLRILVKDDGQGFDPSITRGLGLLGMQERIAHLSGTLRIESAPGQGTVLTVDMPLKGA